MESSESSVRGHGSDAVERLHEQLQESLRALVSSDDWRQALEVAARFHNYSFANTRLIWAQATARGFTPTRVAGYRAWQKLGRQVNRGEKGLQILAPVTRTVEGDDGDEERRVVGFRVVHVFDQSQTDGMSLPEVRPALLEEELPVQWEKIVELIGSAGFGFEVSEADRLGEANGITDWGDRMVVVRESRVRSGSRPRFMSWVTSVSTSRHREIALIAGGSSRWRPNRSLTWFALLWDSILLNTAFPMWRCGRAATWKRFRKRRTG